jgi:hypothetical protein
MGILAEGLHVHLQVSQACAIRCMPSYAMHAQAELCSMRFMNIAASAHLIALLTWVVEAYKPLSSMLTDSSCDVSLYLSLSQRVGGGRRHIRGGELRTDFPRQRILAN